MFKCDILRSIFTAAPWSILRKDGLHAVQIQTCNPIRKLNAVNLTEIDNLRVAARSYSNNFTISLSAWGQKSCSAVQYLSHILCAVFIKIGSYSLFIIIVLGACWWYSVFVLFCVIQKFFFENYPKFRIAHIELRGILCSVR